MAENTAPIQNFELSIELYHEQTTYAAGRMATSAPGSIYHQLYPVTGNASDYWRAQVLWGEEWEPGWRTFRLCIMYGGGDQLTDGFLPGVMYTGAATDAPSEILHFRVGKERWGGGHSYHQQGRGPCQQCARAADMAGIWSVSMRRAS